MLHVHVSQSFVVDVMNGINMIFKYLFKYIYEQILIIMRG